MADILEQYFAQQTLFCKAFFRRIICRREEVILARCRIGHTRLTHAYLLQREEQPECVFCIEPLTVKHLLDCVDLAFVRQQYFAAGTMNQLFNAVLYDNIISYLKETGLYLKF